MKRKLFWTVSFFTILCVIYSLFPYKKGFHLDKIFVLEQFHSQWELPPPKSDIRNILSQPYFYLGHGVQSYVFISNDRKYVVKFFRKKHLTPKKWLTYIPGTIFQKYRYSKIDQKIKNFNKTFGAYKTAYEECKETAGLIYLHLNPTNDLKIQLRLISEQQEWKISLDQYAFVVQEAAEPLNTRLERLMNNHDRSEIINCVRALFQLIKARNELGLVDLDKGLVDNFGFIGQRIIQIDVGRFEPRHLGRRDRIKEIERVGYKLKDLLKQANPEVISDLQNLIDEFCANISRS